MPHKHKKLGIAALKNTKFNKKTISYRKSLKNTPNCISSKLILHTHEFCGLCSYAGLTPIIRQSGSSVNARSRISKMGNAKLRNLLFMCSFNACNYNRACKALYDRIVAKGKSKKLALIAVCNKLLKQAFAIIKNGLPYDEHYKSTLVAN